MVPIDDLEKSILCLLADDVENLERIFRSLCFEFSAEKYDPQNAETFYLRDVANAPFLSEIAEAVTSLLSKGLVEGQLEDGSTPSLAAAQSRLWSMWFRLTEPARSLLKS